MAAFFLLGSLPALRLPSPSLSLTLADCLLSLCTLCISFALSPFPSLPPHFKQMHSSEMLPGQEPLAQRAISFDKIQKETFPL